jgi:hypothetical protein
LFGLGLGGGGMDATLKELEEELNVRITETWFLG